MHESSKQVGQDNPVYYTTHEQSTMGFGVYALGQEVPKLVYAF